MSLKSLINIKSDAILAIFVLSISLSLYTVSCCRNGGIMLSHGLKPNDKLQILAEHNKLRQAVAQGRITGQPAAQNMQEMKWDEELAEKAQQWANECYFKHDPKKYLQRFVTGQNLALMWSTGAFEEDSDNEFPGRIRKWFDEVKKYSYGAKWSVVTGHYTQLIWAETNLVGCGFSYYYYGKKYNKLYVCNYGPAGNINGYNPYATGRTSCENNGLEQSHSYPGLCAVNKDSSHHENVIPQNYYSYQTTNENEHHHLYPAPTATYNTNSHPSYENHHVYNIVYDQHQHQQTHQPPTASSHQLVSHQQHPQQHQIYSHSPSINYHPNPHPSATTTIIEHKRPSFPLSLPIKIPASGISLKSPFSSYRWDLLFNLLHAD